LGNVKGYKFRLDPNQEQEKKLFESTAVQRKSYNYALDIVNKYYEAEGNYPPGYFIKSINKNFTNLKKNNFNYNWFNNVSKCAHQTATLNLNKAIMNYKEGLTEKPKYKSARRAKRSFGFDNVGIKITNNHIKIPVVGYVKFFDSKFLPRNNVKYLSLTVSYKAGHWFISISVEDITNGCNIYNKYKSKVKKHKKIKKSEIIKNSADSNLEVIGYDKGIKVPIMLSNGKKYDLTSKTKKKIRKLEKSHKRLQRKFSHQIKGRKNPKNKIGIQRCNDFIKNNIVDGHKKFSKNSSRTNKRIAVKFNKAYNLRLDAMHKITHDITKGTPKIFISETLAVINMMKNHRLAKSIGERCWSELDRQIKYKSISKGGDFFGIDTFYPSSKLCSHCGNIKKDLKLSDRIYRCDKCGLVIDRDLNAAYNIRDYYLNIKKVPAVGRDLQEIAKHVETDAVRSGDEA
jgi:putative transposase